MNKDEKKGIRNKTIDFSLEDGKEYLDKLLTVNGKISLDGILDKTVLGDSLKVLPYLPEKFVDLLIVDPPYNLTKNFGGDTFKKRSDDSYYEYTETWLKAVLPLLKDNASVYVCCDWQSSGAVERALKNHLNVLNRITWQREKGRGAKKNWKNGMEDIWFATVSENYTFNTDAVKIKRRVLAPYTDNGSPKDWVKDKNGNFRLTCPSNFWDDISVPFWSMPENTAHPTQKPEKLLAKLILASSNSGDVVLDIFGGSGSTSVTAKKLGRRFVSIEQNPQFCVWAEKRLLNADTDKSIQGYNGGVFLERNSYFKKGD